MADPKYICLTCGNTVPEYSVLECPDCGRKSCPSCQGEVDTIENYDEAQKANG